MAIDRPNWENEVRNFLEQERPRQVTDVVIGGVSITILPDVFSPQVFFESGWFAEKISELAKGKSLLEIGPGTGIIGLFAARNGAKVTAIDVNEKAVKNTRENFKKNGLEVRVRVGDVYSPLKREDVFDLIFWNHPFNKSGKKETDAYFRSVFDHQFDSLKTYVAEARNYLAPGGRLLLGTSNIAPLDEIEAIAIKNKYDFKLLDKVERKSEVEDIPTDFRIYEFKDQNP